MLLFNCIIWKIIDFSWIMAVIARTLAVASGIIADKLESVEQIDEINSLQKSSRTEKIPVKMGCDDEFR